MSLLTKLDLVSLKLDGISERLHISPSILTLKMKVCFQMPFRKGCRHHTSLGAWHQFQTVRLHWLSRAFVHLLARHTLQLQLLLWIWSFESHFILLNIYVVGIASIAHIISYLCKIFLPSSFLTIVKFFFCMYPRTFSEKACLSAFGFV